MQMRKGRGQVQTVGYPDRQGWSLAPLGHPPSPSEGAGCFPVVLFTSPCGPPGGAVSTPSPARPLPGGTGECCSAWPSGWGVGGGGVSQEQSRTCLPAFPLSGLLSFLPDPQVPQQHAGQGQRGQREIELRPF